MNQNENPQSAFGIGFIGAFLFLFFCSFLAVIFLGLFLSKEFFSFNYIVFFFAISLIAAIAVSVLDKLKPRR